MKIPRLVLGTQYASGVFNGLMVVGENRQSLRDLLHVSCELGIVILDTAPLYARTIAESVIGEASWDGSIWTKVGVDVTRPLPKPDYAEVSMRAGLVASLRRLRRCRVDVALVHNPAVDVLINLEYSAMRKAWCDLCGGVGVSLHDTADMIRLADEAKIDIDLLLVELPKNSSDWAVATSLGRRYRIALRGIFEQGSWFKNMPRADRCRRIVERALDVIEKIQPDYLVLAPRTVEQLRDYVDLSEMLRNDRP